MEEKKMKLNPKKHQKKARIIKGIKRFSGFVVTVGSLAYTISKQNKKK